MPKDYRDLLCGVCDHTYSDHYILCIVNGCTCQQFKLKTLTLSDGFVEKKVEVEMDK